MEMEKVYQILSYLHLDEDVIQDVAIKVWETRESYNPEAGVLSTWVNAIANNHLISISRSLQYKNDNSTNPLSHFEVEFNDGAVYSIIDEFLKSNEPNALDNMIYLEERGELLNRLKTLRDSDRELLQSYFNEESLSGAERVRVHRLKESIVEGKKWRYELLNVETNEKFFVDTYAEASKICGVKEAAIAKAVKENRLFGKKLWKISSV